MAGGERRASKKGMPRMRRRRQNRRNKRERRRRRSHQPCSEPETWPVDASQGSQQVGGAACVGGYPIGCPPIQRSGTGVRGCGPPTSPILGGRGCSCLCGGDGVGDAAVWGTLPFWVGAALGSSALRPPVASGVSWGSLFPGGQLIVPPLPSTFILVDAPVGSTQGAGAGVGAYLAGSGRGFHALWNSVSVVPEWK